MAISQIGEGKFVGAYKYLGELVDSLLLNSSNEINDCDTHLYFFLNSSGTE
jgi:hypothetical protein